MNRIGIITTLALLLPLTWSCQEDVVGPPTGSVGGFVWNADGTPATGALVTVVYDVPDGGYVMDPDLVIGETTGTDGPLLQGVGPSPHPSNCYIRFRVPEPGELTYSFFDQTGDRYYQQEFTYVDGQQGVYQHGLTNGGAEAWRNGYYVLRLTFEGETVTSNEVLYGLMRNASEVENARPQATTNVAGHFSFPIADLSIGTMIHVTPDEDGEAADAMRVPSTITVIARDEGMTASTTVDLADLDHDYALELVLGSAH